jgi:hypothetical protein
MRNWAVPATWQCRTQFELEAAIRHYLKQLFYLFFLEWVRGHASRRKQPPGFSFDEILNENADDLATIVRNDRALDHDDEHWP